MTLLLLFLPSSPGAISGTASITFAQTGDLKGSGALAGTSAITFAQTGAITGTGKLVGSGTITFGQTGALLGSGILTGTTSITFGQSGNLKGSGALAGTVGITFGITGTMIGPYTVIPFNGQDIVGAHEYFPNHNKDGLTQYYNKAGKRRHGYFPHDLERDDTIVRKKQTISSPAVTQELDWDIYNFFDVALNADTTFTFSNPRDSSDFVILLTKDSNSTVRNIVWPASLAWPDNNSFTTLVTSGETKLLRISYFGGRYRATIY